MRAAGLEPSKNIETFQSGGRETYEGLLKSFGGAWAMRKRPVGDVFDFSERHRDGYGVDRMLQGAKDGIRGSRR
jgi:hypothetical protein